MHIEVWCKSDVGLRRDNNQDSYLIDKNLGLFVVADGMGGHRGGEVASTVAVETAREIVAQSSKEDSPYDIIQAAYKISSKRIYDRSLKEGDLNGMGTTMIMIYHWNGCVYIANVGDSRVYFHSKPHLWQVTEDHSLLNQQLRAGLLAQEQAQSFAAKNIITRSVGFESDVICDIWEHKIEDESGYLLCSDGLTGMINDQRLCEILNDNSSEKAVDICIDEAKRNGGLDNVTVMYVSFRPD